MKKQNNSVDENFWHETRWLIVLFTLPVALLSLIQVGMVWYGHTLAESGLILTLFHALGMMMMFLSFVLHIPPMYFMFVIGMFGVLVMAMLRVKSRPLQLYFAFLLAGLGLFTNFYTPPLNPHDGYSMQIPTEPAGLFRGLTFTQMYVDYQPFEYVIHGWEEDNLYYSSWEKDSELVIGGTKKWRFNARTGELTQLDSAPIFHKLGGKSINKEVTHRLFAEGQSDPTNWYINQIMSSGYISPSGEYTAVVVKHMAYGPQEVVVLKTQD